MGIRNAMTLSLRSKPMTKMNIFGMIPRAREKLAAPRHGGTHWRTLAHVNAHLSRLTAREMRVRAREAHIGEIKNAELEIKNDGMRGKRAREASRRRGGFRFDRAAASGRWKKRVLSSYKEK